MIADTDGLDVMCIETGLQEYQKWNSKQTYRNKIQNEKSSYKFLSMDTLYTNGDVGDLTDFIEDSFCVEKAVVEKETMRQLRAALENWKPWANEAMYCGTMNQCFDYTGWRKIHRQLEKITVRDLVLTENINFRAIQHFYDAIRKKFFKSREYDWCEYRYTNYQDYAEKRTAEGKRK